MKRAVHTEIHPANHWGTEGEEYEELGDYGCDEIC